MAEDSRGLNKSKLNRHKNPSKSLKMYFHVANSVISSLKVM
jgi:hypothetical protein